VGSIECMSEEHEYKSGSLYQSEADRYPKRMGMIKNEVDYVVELWEDLRIYSRGCSVLLGGSGLSSTKLTEHLLRMLPRAQ